MKFRMFILTAVALAGLGLAATGPAQEDKDGPPEGVEVLARGQVHEAFAEAGNAAATPGVVVSKAPPDAIEEQPPEEKPEGDNMVWITGYWGWDEEADDFVWISGAWRTVPAGRSWVPGSWQKVSTGYQWVSGYWGELEQQLQQVSTETDYLPEPPETLDRGASTPAPSEEHTYVPGVHVYQVNRYVWRPGYWVKFRPGWVWTPACYKWTPCGYVYVSGFWDVPLCDRGFLFAPVVIRRAVYLRRGFVYRPAYLIQPDFFIGSLFVRSRSRTYYFGNYFEDRYRRNYVSWVDYRVARVSYDPNYSYYRQAYRKYPTWDRNLRTLYTGRYANDIARPPVTLVQQTKVINTIRTNRTTDTVVHKNVSITNVQNVTVVSPIRKSTTLRVTGLATLAGIKPADIRTAPAARVYKVETLSKERALAERRQIERLRVIGRERKASEVKAFAALPKTGKFEKPVRVKVDLPKTIPAARVFKTEAPPPPPVKIKSEVKIDPPPKDKGKDKGKIEAPPKDKGKIDPPKDKGKIIPPPKDKDKGKIDPPPVKDKGKIDPPKDKDKGKIIPPPKDKDKGKIDPPRDKGKVETPKDKDKAKILPPPSPKDKGKIDPPPVKDKGKVLPPPPPKDKDKGKIDPPPIKEKGKILPPPPPKDKDKDKGKFDPPPLKDKGKILPPPPKDKVVIPPQPAKGVNPPPPKDKVVPPPGKKDDKKFI